MRDTRFALALERPHRPPRSSACPVRLPRPAGGRPL